MSETLKNVSAFAEGCACGTADPETSAPACGTTDPAPSSCGSACGTADPEKK